MSNISLIKFLTYIRIFLWYFVILTSLLTRTFFIIQTWSKIFIIILIFNIICSIINLIIYNYRGYYQKLKYILIIFLPLLTFATCIIYIIYIFNIYYRIMNLLTINIMNNDRNISLLSNTLNHYKCCRIQEEILFDSVNERDYFILFPTCKNIIEENEMKKQQWNIIKTCAPIFRSIIFSIRFFLILDLLLLSIIMIISLIYIWDETDEWIDNNHSKLLITDNINYKVK
ncbi:unnamed protein product [Rotaria sp. Silwood1]|nr:unnamed protein product [Rotaria sp. Silwood1]CAF3664614.1 unnamed protein product [Rotaria sp. Silwood1]CAF4923897.1 unnamed protein product [Rotaria sp. Silwood1]